jgi:hypothetical protein
MLSDYPQYMKITGLENIFWTYIVKIIFNIQRYIIFDLNKDNIDDIANKVIQCMR